MFIFSPQKHQSHSATAVSGVIKKTTFSVLMNLNNANIKEILCMPWLFSYLLCIFNLESATLL